MNTFVRVDLADLKLAELVELYNLATDGTLRKFRDRATALRRTEEALSQSNLTAVRHDDGELDALVILDEPTDSQDAQTVPAPAEGTVPAAPAPTSERPVASATGRPGRPAATPDDTPLTLNVEQNPKRPGTESHERFELYRRARTVGDYIAAGGRRADILWDSDPRRGFITLGA